MRKDLEEREKQIKVLEKDNDRLEEELWKLEEELLKKEAKVMSGEERMEEMMRQMEEMDCKMQEAKKEWERQMESHSKAAVEVYALKAEKEIALVLEENESLRRDGGQGGELKKRDSAQRRQPQAEGRGT